MDAQVFWNIIGQFNQSTLVIQLILLILIIIALILSYTKILPWAIKFVLGITNLFIGFIFFGYYGMEPIQKFFALPLFLIAGILFIYESNKNKDDILNKPNIMQIILLVLYILYPMISYLLGNSFPKMVTHIMPCPIVSLSIAVYAGYRKKNKLLLLILTIWGLTGIKSVFFNAYEDIILLVAGLYGVYILYKMNK